MIMNKLDESKYGLMEYMSFSQIIKINMFEIYIKKFYANAKLPH